jgi:formate-dependent phosphoribosylglycinamide formyltransferase (GAR transformylase)
MHTSIDIDHVHSRAIVREIGERLRMALKPESEIPETLKMQVNRLRELEQQSPSIVPDAEHWKNRRR